MTWMSKITLRDGNKAGKVGKILDIINSRTAGYFLTLKL